MWIIRAKGPFTNIVLHIGNTAATFPTRDEADAWLIGRIMQGKSFPSEWEPVEVEEGPPPHLMPGGPDG